VNEAVGRSAEAEALRGRVILITGSGKGLGAALARACAEARARVVVNCKSDERRAHAIGQEIQRGGGEALVCRADVTSYGEAKGLVEETLRAFGRIDVLVNTVGNFAWKPVAEMEPPDWRAMLASNLDSVFNMCRLVAAYSAAKAGVVAFSKALALEEARSGITVNMVCPGVLANGEESVPESDHVGDRVPTGRLGTPEDVMRAVVFFCSPAADFITGQVLSVSGGWRL
jgi:3-oxoacyl-[acyl-carrier protein] reductase